MKKSKIILHIGFERTGTTSLQRYCAGNQSVLLKHSLLYPVNNLGFSKISHGPLVSSYLPDSRNKDFALPKSNRARPALLRSLFAEIEHTPAHTVLMSSEHFSSRFTGQEIDRLAADFSGYDMRILIYLRSHLSRFFSAYSISVMSGSEQSLEEYAAELTASEHKYMKYKDTILPWQKAFGKKNIIIKLYNTGSDIILDTIETVLGNAELFPIPLDYRDNTSLNPALTEALRLANMALPRAPKQGSPLAYPAWVKQRYLHMILRRVLTRSAQGTSGSRWDLSPERLRNLAEIARTDRQWLTEEYGFHLPDDVFPNDAAPPDCSSPGSMAAGILAKALAGQVGWQRLNIVDLAMLALSPLTRIASNWRARGG